MGSYCTHIDLVELRMTQNARDMPRKVVIIQNWVPFWEGEKGRVRRKEKRRQLVQLICLKCFFHLKYTPTCVCVYIYIYARPPPPKIYV